MERVIGLGGPFIKAKDPKALAEWYTKHLGIPFQGTYAMWMPAEKLVGFTLFSLFKADSDYFSPSTKDTMINFMVKDCFALIETLRGEGVTIAGEPSDTEYGKFGWVVDPEGNKIELWEPPAE
jgi:predicted enzyme related to lactoylglutathione lyase